MRIYGHYPSVSTLIPDLNSTVKWLSKTVIFCIILRTRLSSKTVISLAAEIVEWLVQHRRIANLIVATKDTVAFRLDRFICGRVYDVQFIVGIFVSLYLDYAELQAERQIPMSMEDWAKRLDGFLEFNGNEILTGKGKISAEQAKLHAETEFEKYRIVQDRMFMSDYDRFLLELEEQSKPE